MLESVNESLTVTHAELSRVPVDELQAATAVGSTSHQYIKVFHTAKETISNLLNMG